MKTLGFFKDLDVEKVLISNKISLGEKNYKSFIDYKVKMIMKLSHYI